jgi:hypothetical protein
MWRIDAGRQRGMVGGKGRFLCLLLKLRSTGHVDMDDAREKHGMAAFDTASEDQNFWLF